MQLVRPIDINPAPIGDYSAERFFSTFDCDGPIGVKAYMGSVQTLCVHKTCFVRSGGSFCDKLLLPSAPFGAQSNGYTISNFSYFFDVRSGQWHAHSPASIAGWTASIAGWTGYEHSVVASFALQAF